MKPLAERLWAKVDRSGGPDACWPWTGARTNPKWHGRIMVTWRPRRMIIVSRAVWELTFGPIPDGLLVLHSCDNPICSNPRHLMLGTARANSVDAGRKGRLGVGRHATHCRRGHAFAGNTYTHPVTGRRECQACIDLRSLARSSRHQRRPRSRAGGGPIRPAMPYIVGERGPEVFSPSEDGTVLGEVLG